MGDGVPLQRRLGLRCRSLDGCVLRRICILILLLADGGRGDRAVELAVRDDGADSDVPLEREVF